MIVSQGQTEVRAVMSCFVSDSTKKTYEDRMTNYMLWLNDCTDICAISED